jgi:glutamine synthetase
MELPNELELTDRLHVDVNIFSVQDEDTYRCLPALTTSCWESAELLLRDHSIYERGNVFFPGLIDRFTEQLRSHGDCDFLGT